jgi:hypothetical protein
MSGKKKRSCSKPANGKNYAFQQIKSRTNFIPIEQQVRV